MQGVFLDGDIFLRRCQGNVRPIVLVPMMVGFEATAGSQSLTLFNLFVQGDSHHADVSKKYLVEPTATTNYFRPEPTSNSASGRSVFSSHTWENVNLYQLVISAML